MALNDILLHVDSYPDPTPNATIDEAVALTVKLGGRVSAQAFAIRIPLRRNAIADRLVGLSGMAREEEARSLAAAQAGLAQSPPRPAMPTSSRTAGCCTVTSTTWMKPRRLRPGPTT